MYRRANFVMGMKRIHLTWLALGAVWAQLAGRPEAEVPEWTPRVYFRENKGQVKDQHWRPRPDVLFSGETEGLVYHLREDGMHYQLSAVETWEPIPEKLRPIYGRSERPGRITIYRVDIDFLSCTKPTIEALDPFPWYENFYNVPAGVEPALHVRSYRQVWYRGLWEGIDMVFYEGEEGLEYDLMVKPGADPSVARFLVKGANVYISAEGELIMETPLGQIREHRPKAWAAEREVPVSWKVTHTPAGAVVALHVEGRALHEPLRIDPGVRIWGTFLGRLAGGRSERDTYGHAVATHGTTAVYIAGITYDTNDLATAGTHQTSCWGGVDAFLNRFDPTNGQRVWGTYFGGNYWDEAWSCVVDNNGDIYIAGNTTSTTGVAGGSHVHQGGYGGGGRDAFLAKFNPSGHRIWSTYYGGGGDDFGWGCAVEGTTHVYLVGQTNSSNNIATAGAHKGSYSCFNTSTCVQPDWSCDCNCNCCSWNYVNVTCCPSDGFVVKFTSGGVRVWGTYLGGNGDDVATACAVLPNGDVFVAGYTGSGSDIATGGTHQPNLGNAPCSYGAQQNCDWDGNCWGYVCAASCTFDAFVMRFSASGVRQMGTYYGGSGDDGAWGCSVDGSGNVFISGWTSSNNGIATPGAFQTSRPGGSSDGFVAKLNGNTLQRIWGTYVGTGADWEELRRCRTDHIGHVYAAGTMRASGLASPGAHQTWHDGDGDGFIIKLDGGNGTRLWASYCGGRGPYHYERGMDCAPDGAGHVYLAGHSNPRDGKENIATWGTHIGPGTDFCYRDFTHRKCTNYAFLVKFCGDNWDGAACTPLAYRSERPFSDGGRGGWNIYPRVSNGIIEVEAEEAVVLEVWDAAGRQLLTFSLGAGERRKERLPLAPGAYFVRNPATGESIRLVITP